MFRVNKSKPEPQEPARPAPAAPQPQQQERAPQGVTNAGAPPQAAPQGANATTTQPQPAQPALSSAAQQQAATRALSETEQLARGIKEGGVGGFVGNASELSGEVRFRGMMRVDGRVSGRVVSDDGTLIVSSGGRVEADVEVAVAKINGTVEGDVTASERIELGRTARVQGDLQTPALIVEQGAIFEGNCRMGVMATPARQKTAA
jgi:cytoskeletal protein CcmA (bactofilin family)